MFSGTSKFKGQLKIIPFQIYAQKSSKLNIGHHSFFKIWHERKYDGLKLEAQHYSLQSLSLTQYSLQSFKNTTQELSPQLKMRQRTQTFLKLQSSIQLSLPHKAKCDPNISESGERCEVYNWLPKFKVRATTTRCSNTHTHTHHMSSP